MARRSPEDKTILQQRLAFTTHIAPLVDGILQDDSAVYEAISSLKPNQRAEIITAIVDFAAVQKYGRTQREAIGMGNRGRKNRRPEITDDRLFDPLGAHYIRNLRRLDVNDPEGYLGIIENAADTVLTALHMDPLIPPLKQAS